MEDPRSGESNNSEDDKRRDGDRDLDRSGNVQRSAVSAVAYTEMTAAEPAAEAHSLRPIVCVRVSTRL